MLVLVPTRELALQVSEAFLRYAAHLKGFHVLPIYGGQSYQPQLNALRRGVHVVVGTPGRVIDHMNRGTLKLSGLTLLVLDEADEMLRMGFIDAVESILEQTPPQRQVALFSATIPAPIRRIAAKHLRTPVEVTIKSKTSTATNIRQRYWMVSGMHKLDALTRILEAETFDGMLVFTRTKQATVELAEKLEARGFAAAPLNGDIRAAAAGAHGRTTESRADRHPGRHRCGGPRPRCRTHRSCGELRCALRHRILCASHRPHRQSGTQGRGHPVHRARASATCCAPSSAPRGKSSNP